MIAKTKANKSFRGTTKYVVEKAQAKIIGGNMVGTETNQLVAQFMVSRTLNPKVKDPCYHLMLSLPHSESLSDEKFAELGERHFATVVILSQLTGEKAKLTTPDKRISDAELNSKVDKFLEDKIHAFSFFIARHSDKEHDHIHIVASRINEITTHAIKTWKQYPQSEWSARLLEKRFGLEQIPCSWESKTKALTRSQRDHLEKDGLPGAEIMRRFIDEAARDKPTMPVLIERLAQKGIMAEVSSKSTGQVRGIRFSINVGEVDEKGNPKLLSMTGGGLNRHKYSFPKLISELGVSYIPERDDKALKATLGKAQKLLAVSPIIISGREEEVFKSTVGNGQKMLTTSPITTPERDEAKTQEGGEKATAPVIPLPQPQESPQKLEQQEEKIRRIIDTVAANQPTFTELIHRLQSRGIKPSVQVTRTGKIQGISFELEGENLKFSGTELGEKYSFKGLQRHFGVDFDLERDVEAIAEIVHSNSSRKEAIQNQPTERIIQLLLENKDNLTLSVPQVQKEEKKEGQGEKLSSPSSAVPASDEAHPEQLNQPTDAELLAQVRAVEQWKKTRPRQPSPVRGENLKKRIDELNQQKANWETQRLLKERELEELGKPRSLLNPFGVSESVIDDKRRELAETRTAINDIEFQLRSARDSLKKWQQEVRNYQAWQENPQTQEMEKKAENLKSAPLQERRQRLKEGYAIYAAAQYILDSQGKQKDNSRYFQGKVYRIEKSGETLTISRQDRSEPLYVATDYRGRGGILEISQFNLTSKDKEIIQGYAEYLEEQSRQKSEQLER